MRQKSWSGPLKSVKVSKREDCGTGSSEKLDPEPNPGPKQQTNNFARKNIGETGKI